MCRGLFLFARAQPAPTLRDNAEAMIARDERALGLLLAVLATVALAREAGAWSVAPRAIAKRPSATVAAVTALAEGRAIDLNLATAADLALLPRIGPRLADRIVAARRERGGFRSVSDLDAIPGIGPRTLAELTPFLRVAP